MRHSFARLLRRALLCPIAAGLAGCAASPPPSGLTLETTHGVVGDHASGINVLAASEIDGLKTPTAYDAIVALRPRFLAVNQPRGVGRAAVPPSVVIEKGFPESLTVLKSIQASDIAEIRYLESWESTTKFGSEYTAGMILVRLRALHPAGR
jgi:hypothetical protein